MLACIRRLVALLVLLAFAAAFIPWGGGAAWWSAVPEYVQLVPTMLSSLSGEAWALPVLAFLLLLTLLFGRVYCSWLCPLGIVQDLANRAARPRPRAAKGRFLRHRPNHPRLRLCFGLLGFGLLLSGSVGLLTWLDPYSIAARGMAAFLSTLLHGLAGAEVPEPDWERYAPWMMAAVALGLALPLVLALWRGRLYCNSICPVGALLGLLARPAPCTPHIDAERCGRCAACLRSCKAQAIDLKSMQVDASRCVACYNCVSGCSKGAMTLRPHAPFAPKAEARKTDAGQGDDDGRKGHANATRRALLGMGFAGLALAVWPRAGRKVESTNPAEPGDNDSPAAVPPGAQSVEHLLEHCTACGLCISRCPTQVLRPSLLGLGLGGFMKPTLDFSHGYCKDDCRLCSSVCPAGALLPLSLEQKQRTQIGLVQYAPERCIVWTEGKPCARCVTASLCPTGALEAKELAVPFIINEACRGCRRCLRVCPAGAISMVQVEGREKRLAVIDRSKCAGCGACAAACRPKAIDIRRLIAPRLVHPGRCIGCGACQHACPVHPQKAMVVTPRAEHLEAEERGAQEQGG